MSRLEPTCIDLFCGCGGFTLGMQRAGFKVLAAIDWQAEAVSTLNANLVVQKHPGLIPVTHALQRDLTQYHPAALALHLGTTDVDVIVGGPPCQGFSTARKVGGANHGSRLKADPRRHLYREFLRYVDFFQPRVFVMENVLGLRTTAGGEYFTRVQKEARELGRSEGKPGYCVHGQIEDAWELGVPQKRHRQLIIGVRNDLPGYFLPDLKPAPRAVQHTTLGAAIGDLPILHAAGGDDERDYNIPRRSRHLQVAGFNANNYLFNVLEIHRTSKLYNHVARPHSQRDLRDFARLNEGENSAAAMRIRGVAFEFPYDKSTFKDRYTRQSRYKPCSTIVAHLSKDGLMFIHPTQNRSLTPREAARIQSFPDWFRFPEARTHAFRLIGNAVPPLIGEAVGLEVKSFLKGTHCSDAVPKAPAHNPNQARGGVDRVAGRISQNTVARADDARALERLASLDRRALRAVSAEEFLRGWHALLSLFPSLHPDNALDHGQVQEPWPEAQLVLPGLEVEKRKVFARSGWPVALELIGHEAWRRYEAGEFSSEKFYCVAAQRVGLQHRKDAFA